MSGSTPTATHSEYVRKPNEFVAIVSFLPGPPGPALRCATFRMSRRIVTFASLAAVSLGAVGCERSNTDILKAAIAARDSVPPDYAGAQRSLDEILNRTAESADENALRLRRDAYFHRSIMFRSMGLLNAAESDLKAIIETIDGADGDALLQLATVLASRGDERTNDFQLAIDHAKRSYNFTNNAGALIAKGVAHMKRARLEMNKLRRDLFGWVVGGNFDDLMDQIAVAVGLPASDPRAISLQRELDKRLELRTNDIRLRVAETINFIRNDYTQGRADLFKAVAAYPSPDYLLLSTLMVILRDVNQLDDAILIGKLGARVPVYAAIPDYIDSLSISLEEGGFDAEAAETYRAFIERGRGLMTAQQKSRALEAARKTGNVNTLESMVSTIRGQLRRDPASQLIGRLLEYYDGVILSLKNAAPIEIARKVAPFVLRRDIDTTQSLPGAALLAAQEYKKAGDFREALRMADIGFAAEPENEQFAALRASLMSELNEDPLSFGKLVRLAIVNDPNNIITYLPTLHIAADRFVSKTAGSIKKLLDESSARGDGVPKGFSEGWLYLVFSIDYLEIGKYEESALCALEALARDGELLSANIPLGLSYARTGRLKEARNAFFRAIDSLPPDPELLQKIVLSGAAPADVLLRMFSARPEIEGRILMARSMDELGNFEEAEKILSALASSDQAPDEALLLAAQTRSARAAKSAPAPRGATVAEIDPFLSRITAVSPHFVRAKQLYLEAAILRGDTDQVSALASKLELQRDKLDRKHLLETIQLARSMGRAATAAAACELLQPTDDVDAKTARTLRTAALHQEAMCHLESGETKKALRALDRLVALRGSISDDLLLALTLHESGDLKGCARMVGQLRADWSTTPNDFRRAALDVLAGVEPTEEEVQGAVPSSEKPLSILAYVALAQITTGAPPPLGDDATTSREWVKSAMALAARSKELSLRVERLCLLATCDDAQFLTLQEIGNIRAKSGESAFLDFIEAGIREHLDGPTAGVLELYTRSARSLVDYDVPWAQALRVARYAGDAPKIEAVSEAWARLCPASRDAQLARNIVILEQSLTTPDRLEGATARLASLVSDHPGNFEACLALLKAQVQRGNVADITRALKSIHSLVTRDAGHARRAAAWISKGYQMSLPDNSKDSLQTASALLKLVPDSAHYLELLAATHIADKNYDAASSELLQFLRLNAQTVRIPAASVRELVRKIAPFNPGATAEIARLALASEPGSPERWDIYVECQRAIGDESGLIAALEALHKINPSVKSGSLLADALSQPGRNPGKALALLGSSAREGEPLGDALARARALRLLNRAGEAVALLESRVGAVATIRPSLRLEGWEAAIPPSWNDGDNKLAALELAYCYAIRGNDGDLEKANAALNFAKVNSPGPDLERATSVGGAVVHFRVVTPRTNPASAPAAESGK